MDRRTRNLFALVLVAVIVVTGAAAFLLGRSSLIDPGAPANATAVDGVIVAVDSAGLSDVRGFTLRRPGGEILVFRLGELENGDQFPPAHLAEHQATAAPVRVWYRIEGSERFAVRLEDAPG